jgi:hypothetical protein
MPDSSGLVDPPAGITRPMSGTERSISIPGMTVSSCAGGPRMPDRGEATGKPSPDLILV